MAIDARRGHISLIPEASMTQVQLPYPFTLEFREETDSTNDDAKALAPTALDFTMVWAKLQNKGRGRLGRAWKSPVGNIFCSTILRRDTDIPPVETISIPVGLAIAETVASFASDPASVKVKWVNDVLVNDKKISGILCEGGDDTGWIVVGIGINVAVAPDLEGEYQSTSVNELAERIVPIEEVLTALCTNLYSAIERWRRHGFDDVFREQYFERCWRLNEKIEQAFDKDKTLRSVGINRGIDDQGRLLLEIDGVIKPVFAGDVLRPRSEPAA
jgi:BirA family transcriptional regulator, biotin operon repressor / biotin---[acetyl-CoA-carboxylase] ligase